MGEVCTTLLWNGCDVDLEGAPLRALAEQALHAADDEVAGIPPTPIVGDAARQIADEWEQYLTLGIRRGR